MRTLRGTGNGSHGELTRNRHPPPPSLHDTYRRHSLDKIHSPYNTLVIRRRCACCVVKQCIYPTISTSISLLVARPGQACPPHHPPLLCVQPGCWSPRSPSTPGTRNEAQSAPLLPAPDSPAPRQAKAWQLPPRRTREKACGTRAPCRRHRSRSPSTAHRRRCRRRGHSPGKTGRTWAPPETDTASSRRRALSGGAPGMGVTRVIPETPFLPGHPWEPWGPTGFRGDLIEGDSTNHGPDCRELNGSWIRSEGIRPVMNLIGGDSTDRGRSSSVRDDTTRMQGCMRRVASRAHPRDGTRPSAAACSSCTEIP